MTNVPESLHNVTEAIPESAHVTMSMELQWEEIFFKSKT